MKRGPKGPSKYTQDFIEAQAEALNLYTEKSKETDSFPQLAEFAYLAGFPNDEIDTFCQKSEEFSLARKKMMDLQQIQLCKKGLGGDYDKTLTIFLLKNNHGFKDEHHVKSEHDEKRELTLKLSGLDNEGLRALIDAGRRRALPQGAA